MCIAGARPNFVKIAPLVNQLGKFPDIYLTIVHTGQHYDDKMSDVFFKTLNIPNPTINLKVGPGSHATQTAEIMRNFEPFLLEQKPDLVLVVGDVNSTLACALVAKKMHIKVAHVEAGLRSFDQRMPEEVNRLLTDHISDFLFVTEKVGLTNLKNEGMSRNKVFFVGNVMIDTLVQNLHQIEKLNTPALYGLDAKKYLLLTLHRPSNVDSIEKFEMIIKSVMKAERKMPILFPVHPRTKKNIESETIKKFPNLILLEPLPYLDFMSLVKNAHAVFTDSGGIQQETTFLKIPCVTLRSKTEILESLKCTNTLTKKISETAIIKSYKTSMSKTKKCKKAPKYWDGKASQRIVKILRQRVKGS